MRKAREAVVIAVIVSSALVLGACGSGGRAPKAAPSTAPIVPESTSTATPSASTSSTTLPRLGAAHLRLVPVVSGLSSPVAILFRPPGGPKTTSLTITPGSMYVVEQTGSLRLIRNGHAVSPPALDLRAHLSHGNEQGFLGAAFSRDGAHLYVSYTDRDGNTNVDEYAMRGTNAVASTSRRVFFKRQPFPNHNGGEVTLGPDGMLYIGLGDGGSEDDPGNYGQNLASPLSKILRIDPTAHGRATYAVPADNPFVGRAGALPETWMWGLRNPWRFSFDRLTGDTWIGDVGQNTYEEIDFAPRGQAGINWGWSKREGFHSFKGGRPAGARDPIVEAPHRAGYCAIVGGYVYRGRAIPKLYGAYLYGDDCRSGIEALVQRNGRAVAQRDLGLRVQSTTTFGEDGTGELYVASRTGTVYRIAS